MPSPVYACTRVSTGPQAKQYGPTTQLEDIRSFASSQRLSVTEHIHETQSGWDKLEDRERVQQYFALARANREAIFIFPRVNRLGRRSSAIQVLVETLLEIGARVHVVGIDGDLHEKEVWFLFCIMAGHAELEYRTGNETMLKGKIKKVEKGGWAHGKPPHGLEIIYEGRNAVGVKLVEPAAGTVKRLLELGWEHGAGTVADKLTLEGHLNASGLCRWSTSTVHNALRNEIYSGVYVFGKRGKRAEGLWTRQEVPALVERAWWLELQDRITERSRVRPTRGTAGLLTGHLRCAECGGGVSFDSTPNPRKPGERYTHYRCWRSNAAQARRAHLEQCGNTRAWNTADLERQVWEFLLEHLPDPVKLGAILGQDEKPIDHSSEKERLKDLIKRAGQAYTRGLLSELEADEEARGSRERLRELEALERSGPVRIDAIEMAQALRQALEQCDTLEGKRAFLKRFGVRVRVGVEGIVGVRVRV